MAAHVPAAKVGVSLFPIDAAMRASCGDSALESAPAKREGAIGGRWLPRGLDKGGRAARLNRMVVGWQIGLVYARPALTRKAQGARFVFVSPWTFRRASVGCHELP